MDARLASYEKAKQAHLHAVGAYDGAKSAAAKAAAVKNIGHGHLAQKNCAKFNGPIELSGSNGGTKTAHKRSLSACVGECDYDDDCKKGLKCFQREKGETIP